MYSQRQSAEIWKNGLRKKKNYYRNTSIKCPGFY